MDREIIEKLEFTIVVDGKNIHINWNKDLLNTCEYYQDYTIEHLAIDSIARLFTKFSCLLTEKGVKEKGKTIKKISGWEFITNLGFTFEEFSEYIKEGYKDLMKLHKLDLGLDYKNNNQLNEYVVTMISKAVGQNFMQKIGNNVDHTIYNPDIEKYQTECLNLENKPCFAIASNLIIETANTKGIMQKLWEKSSDNTAIISRNWGDGYVDLVIADNEVPLSWEKALENIKKLDLESALINLYFTSLCFQAYLEGKTEFILDIHEINQELGFDKKRGNKSVQMAKTMGRIQAISSIYVDSFYPVERIKKSKGEIIIKKLELQVREHLYQIKFYILNEPTIPGLRTRLSQQNILDARLKINVPDWVKKFFNPLGNNNYEAVCYYAYLSTQFLKLDANKNSLAFAILLYVAIQNRIHGRKYKVKTLLLQKWNEEYLNKITGKNFRHKRSEVKNLFIDMICLGKDLGWDFDFCDDYPDAFKPNTKSRARAGLFSIWLKSHIIIKQPIPIPEKLDEIKQGKQNFRQINVAHDYSNKGNNKLNSNSYSLAKRVKDARHSLGLTQKQLVAKCQEIRCNFSLSYLKLIETGKRIPSQEIQEGLAKILNINI